MRPYGTGRRLAGHLAGLGVRRGSRVAVCLANCVELVESYLGIVRAAGVAVALNPHLSDAEFGALLDDCDPRMLITDAVHAEQAARVRPEELDVVLVGEEFDRLCTSDPPVVPQDALKPDDAAWIFYTSGTTARPKGVLSSQRSYLALVAGLLST